LPSNPLELFTYDEVGNRTDSNQNGTSIFNDGNQLTEDADFTYQYDANGNLIQKTDKSTLLSTVYEYDAENRLIRVASLDKTVNYEYDGLNRRIEKEVTETATTTTTRYIYDNEDILLELDGSNNIIARYTHGPGIDEPLITERGGQSFFYHADVLGTVTDLTDSVGTVVQSYSYSSFGKIESQLDPAFIQPYTFTAREFDPETGLYHYRMRYLNPDGGRFLSEDLVRGSLNFPQTLNLYPYVGNNPVNRIDPSGLINFLVGGGLSGVAPTGAETSGGVVINPGLFGQQADVGVFTSLGAGGGVNVSADVFLGFIRGGIENVSGPTANINITLGSGPLGLSVTTFTDARTGEIVGFTIGVGPGATPIGASGTYSVTGTYTLRDFLRFLFGRGIAQTAGLVCP